uniref:Uncharacterized protein n=1 Tax=Pyramimonas orientalis virus TaxID=455367 RepID=A0A7L9AYP1_POV01|nr:hypothetical protein HWQ62_00223 [Pyramimonas orientalis virus]
MYKYRCSATTLANRRCKRTATYVSTNLNVPKIQLCTHHYLDECKRLNDVSTDEEEDDVNTDEEDDVSIDEEDVSTDEEEDDVSTGEEEDDVSKNRNFEMKIMLSAIIGFLIGLILNNIRCDIYITVMRDILLKCLHRVI